MKTSFRSLALALTLAAAFLLGATAAHAQTGTPQSPYVVTSAPYTINKSGYYILGNNINYTGTSGNIITISTSNVTLDFNGFYIAGAVNNTSQTTVGVFATEQSNITIKNGTIAYCNTGIYLSGNGSATTNAVGEVVDNMRVTYCYNTGISVYYCPASRIQNCQVSQTGFSGANTVYGIYAYGTGVSVQNNTVSTVYASTGIGILAVSGFARQNTVSNAYYGVYFGKYQDNLTLTCTYPYSGGIDAGGNN